MGVFHLFKILQSVLNRVKQSVGSRLLHLPTFVYVAFRLLHYFLK